VSDGAAAAGQRRKQSAIAAALGISLIFGIVYGAISSYLRTSQQQFMFQMAGNIVLLGVGFYWLHYDSLEHNFRRSALLNTGIVAFALIFVPYYFFRTRSEGKRVRPILSFLGLIIATSFLSVAGMSIMLALAGSDA
jgi:hypothetical protein